MKKTIITILLLIILGIGIFLIIQKKQPQEPTALDTFAQCIKDSGTVFYGAFWCPHCNNQKAMFGKSAKLLPYQECSLANHKQTPVCTEKNISSYPTWEFPDGTRLTGELSFAELAEKTSCPLPEEITIESTEVTQ